MYDTPNLSASVTKYENVSSVSWRGILKPYHYICTSVSFRLTIADNEKGRGSLDAPEVVVSPTGAQLDCNIPAKDLDELLERLQPEPAPVLDAPSPLVRALVGGAVEELVHEIPISAVYCY